MAKKEESKQLELELIYSQVVDKKKKIKVINDMFKDALINHPDYEKLMEKRKKLNAEVNKLKKEVAKDFTKEFDNRDKLKTEIDDHVSKMSDIAVNEAINGRNVTFKDQYGNDYRPYIIAKFTKN